MNSIAHAVPALHACLLLAVQAAPDAQALLECALAPEVARALTSQPPARLLAPLDSLATARLDHLRSLPAPPAHSWAIPGAEAVGRPNVTAFLRSQRRELVIPFHGIAAARRFAKLGCTGGPGSCPAGEARLRCTGVVEGDVVLTPNGTGAKAQVGVRKSGQAHARALAAYAVTQEAIARLECVLGLAAAAGPPGGQGEGAPGVQGAGASQVLGKRSTTCHLLLCPPQQSACACSRLLPPRSCLAPAVQ